MIRTIPFLISVLFLSDCAPVTWTVGGTCKVYNPTALHGASVVCVFPVLRTVEGNEIPPDDSTSFELWTEIDSRKLFLLVPLEKVELALREHRSSDSTGSNRICQSVRADAYIMSRLNYYSSQTGRPIADLWLQVVDSKTDNVTAYAHDNTYIAYSNYSP